MTDSDDDFCMQMYDWAETRQTQRMQEVAEAEERWWIVMHDKVAVRPAPSTEGRPLAVLPRGAVVKVSGIKTVEGGRRWLTVDESDLAFFRPKKKESSAEAAVAALAAPTAAYILIEGTVAGLGKLMMVAPKDFDWDNVAGIVPKRRGEVAQSQMVGGMPSEITDEYIEQLLAEGDAKAAEANKRPTAAGKSLPPSSGGTVGFTEDDDGLVDVDLSRKDPAAVAMAAAAGLGGRTAYVRAKDGTAQLVSKFDQIMFAQAQVSRSEREREEMKEHSRIRAEREEKQRKEFSYKARAKAATDSESVPHAGAVDPWAPYRDNPPGWPENPDARDGLPAPNFESFNDVGMMQLMGQWPADRPLPKGPAYIPPTDGSPAYPRLERFR